eukprot:TRINITY_DN7076_c0_g1_i1.p1 TRINITY_DN7076_c0_g1~~TRINITY_DN7076_c0_g1_i1.p1  ORF type:complete len:307 (-),score=77.15 TRINITY_DN7076_c0_g1_i1:70-990(-)
MLEAIQEIQQEKNIDYLLDINSDKIDTLRNLVGDVLEETHDDIFLLRYVLSFARYEDNWKKAIEAVRFTIEYRKQNESWLSKAKSEGLDGAPNMQIIKNYACCSLHKTTKEGGPILIVRSGLCNGSKLMSKVTPEDVAKFLLYEDEVAYLHCDKIAREERRLVKMVVINDMKGFSILNNSKHFFEALGISTKISEKIYPQLLEKSVAVNPKTIYKFLISLAGFVVPHKTMEKFSYCKGQTEGGDISKCPFASKYLLKENLPTFLGGSCECKGLNQHWGDEGCIDGISNEANVHPFKKETKKNRRTI